MKFLDLFYFILNTNIFCVLSLPVYFFLSFTTLTFCISYPALWASFTDKP